MVKWEKFSFACSASKYICVASAPRYVRIKNFCSCHFFQCLHVIKSCAYYLLLSWGSILMERKRFRTMFAGVSSDVFRGLRPRTSRCHVLKFFDWTGMYYWVQATAVYCFLEPPLGFDQIHYELWRIELSLGSTFGIPNILLEPDFWQKLQNY